MSYVITRETYYVALYGLLTPLKPGTVKTMSRRLTRAAEEHNDSELPALYLVLGEKSKTVQKYKQEPERTLAALAIIYVANPDQETASGIALNDLIDAVEAAIAPSPAHAVQTLGGLVHQCAIVGETETFENIAGTRATAMVPIEMLIP